VVILFAVYIRLRQCVLLLPDNTVCFVFVFSLTVLFCSKNKQFLCTALLSMITSNCFVYIIYNCVCLCAYFIYCKGFVVTHFLSMEKIIIIRNRREELTNTRTHKSLFFYPSRVLFLSQGIVCNLNGRCHTCIRLLFLFSVSCLCAFSFFFIKTKSV
jgi:hypothetical protein